MTLILTIIDWQLIATTQVVAASDIGPTQKVPMSFCERLGATCLLETSSVCLTSLVLVPI